MKEMGHVDVADSVDSMDVVDRAKEGWVHSVHKVHAVHVVHRQPGQRDTAADRPAGGRRNLIDIEGLASYYRIPTVLVVCRA